MAILIIVSIFILISVALYRMILTQRSLYSIYYLISVFIMATVYMFLLGLELIAILYVLLYLGAIVVLYIISIYILGSNLIDDFEKTANFRFNWIIGFFFLFIIYKFNDQVATMIYFIPLEYFLFVPDFLDTVYQVNKNTDILAFIIFDYYPVALLLGSLILLIAMLGAIILTLQYLIKKK